MKRNLQEVDSLAQIRAEFDNGFSKPAQVVDQEFVEVLGFRAGDGAYAVDLRDVSAVHKIRAVTRVPVHHPGFDGLISVRDELVAVFDLAVLIAAPNPAASRRWLLVCRGDRQVGFAVDVVDGYLRIPRNAIVQTSAQKSRSSAVNQAIDEGHVVRLVVDFPLLLSSIRRNVEREAQSAR